MEKLTNSQLHKKIKKALTNEGTVLFIGSGVSAWSGLPSWQRLLDELVAFIENKGISSADVRFYKDTQPLIAAGIGRNILNEDEFANFIRSSCRVDAAKPHLIHELIADLGSSCYITTNYDSLLEQTLQQRGLLEQYEVVSNRKAMDCAAIVHIRKKNFIFKPHGDVGNCESIILSAEQYQRLYENGDKAYVYRTLETLLLTRTIVFIGFGLTDPDFLHIIGKIKNEFKHNPRDHFAIVADVSNIERDYWFLNYGIQILSYETLHTENGRDYSSLLPLLRSLITKNKKNLQKAFPQKLQRKGAWITSNQKLKLERYARYLIQQFKTPGDIVFPLMLKRYKADGSYFDHVSSLDVQNTTSQSFILTGNPGAGKTFFLRQYCTKIAEKLQKWCINPKENTFPKIPIYIDLKGYSGKGTLRTMIESQLPEGIPIMDWIENNKIILLLDSFNEVDKKFLDNHACLHELKKYNYENTVVIASRFKEPLDNLYLPEYHLLEIEKDYVGEFLEQRGYTMPDRNQEEFFAHFQKPLFFNLLKQGKLTFYSDPNPISPLWSYFNYLNTAFNDSFEYCLVWEDVFQELAYNLCKKGTERFRVVELYELLAVKMIKNDKK